MSRGQCLIQSPILSEAFGSLFVYQSLEVSSNSGHQMPPKSKKEEATAETVKTNNIDGTQVVTLNVLKEFLDSQTRDLTKTIEEKYESIQKEISGQKKKVANLEKDQKAMASSMASNERKMREDNKAKKELVISDYQMISEERDDQIDEIFNKISLFDDDLVKYEVRHVERIGSDDFIRYVITVCSEHVRDRILCKALDKKMTNFKAGQSKAERKERSRIHAMKVECHEKNSNTNGNFLWEVWTAEGEVRPQIMRFGVDDPRVKKLKMKYLSETSETTNTGRKKRGGAKTPN